MTRWALLCALLAACGEEGPFTIVTIEAQPAVGDVAELVISLTNEGTTLEDRVAVEAPSFPETFSIETTGRTGVLEIAIDALDRDGLLVGRGVAETDVTAPTASVTLDSADFVASTSVAENQFPADDLNAAGFQLAADASGVWTVVFRGDCPAEGCHMLARRFDVTGRPVDSALAAGPNEFQVSTELTTDITSPAVATSGDTTIAVWNFSQPAPGTLEGVACRALDASGAARGDQVAISVETLPLQVSAAPLPGGRFVVAWNGFETADVIRGGIVDAACQPSNVATVSTVTGTLGASHGAVATNGERVLYAWVLDGDVRGRIADAANSFLTTDIPLVAKTATEQVEHVRVAPLGAGFAIVVRWALIGADNGPGRLELYRVNDGGQLQGAPVVISERSGSDALSRTSFGVATRPDDGALLVAWHACEDNGDGNGCGVFGHVVSAAGVPVGDDLVIATTTVGDQVIPSVVGLPGAFAATWLDTSEQPPDKSGTAVRARVLYPPLDAD